MLCLTVSWLTDRYHGAEWPPAPLRVYQALIAGASTAGGISEDQLAALRLLDELPAPRIMAAPTRQLEPMRTAVPNNDMDVVMDQHAKKGAAVANKTRRELYTMRTWQARGVTGPVTYIWPHTGNVEAHLDALQSMAQAVTAVGHGIDLAWARVHLGDPPAQPEDHLYEPAPSSGRHLTVPYPGALDALNETYAERLRAVGPSTVRSVLDPDHRRMGYRSDLDPPQRRHVAFALRRPDGQPYKCRGVRCAEVAAMVRNRLQQAGEAAGLSQDTLATIMGHGRDGGDNRARILPLPNAGHEYADGFIRRVIIAMPPVLDEASWQALILRLTGGELTPPGASEPSAILTAAQADDRVLPLYTEPARTWTTATPVILPGFDSRNGKRREGKAIRRLLRHAGIPLRLLEHARFEATPIAEGSHHHREHMVPEHLRRLPRTHLTVTWAHEVPGPFSLGAGEGYGLGTFVHAWEN